MKRFTLAIFALILLFPVNAEAVSTKDCTFDTAQCRCFPSDIELFPITSDEACYNACRGYAQNPEFASIATWSIQCEVDERVAVVATGMIEEEEEVIEENDKSAAPILGVAIPGLNFKDGDNGNYIGLYVEALYKYLLAVGGFIAVLMFSVAGLQWMTARGDASKVTQAKDRMANASFGIILLFGAYSIGFLISPDTVVFDTLNIDNIDPIQYVQQSGDASGTRGIEPGDPRIDDSILCQTAGGANLYDIAISTAGKITYRYGAKGGTAPYVESSGNYWSKKKDADGVLYSTYCPEGQLCFDCSGYVDFLAACADLPSMDAQGGTVGIFSREDAEPITSCADTTINGVSLQQGDLVGWSGNGHVWIYIGNGKLADSHGTRGPGQAVGIYDTSSVCDKFGSRDHGLNIVRRDS